MTLIVSIIHFLDESLTFSTIGIPLALFFKTIVRKSHFYCYFLTNLLISIIDIKVIQNDNSFLIQSIDIKSIESNSKLMFFFHVLVTVDFYLYISIYYDWFFQIFCLWFLVVMFDAETCFQRLFQLDVVLCQIFLYWVMIDRIQFVVSALSIDLCQ